MSREIKFRAFDKKSGKMLPVRQVTQHFEDTDYGYKASALEAEMVNGEPVLFDPDVPFLMQYTGLRDKNGVEIYEGDILRGVMIYGSIGDAVIVYRHGAFVTEHIRGEKGYDYLSDHISHEEVIGNIYENPELLKGVA